MRKRRQTTENSGVSTAVILTLTVATLYFARDVLIPIALSVLLAFLLARPVSWLERRHVGRVPAVLAVVIVAFAFIGSIGYIVGQQVISLASNLDHYQSEIEHKARSLRGTGSGLGRVVEKLSNDLKSASESPSTKPATAPTTLSAGAPGVVANAAKEVSSDPSKAIARETMKAPPTTAPGEAGSTPANPLYTIPQAQPESPVQTLFSYLSLIAGPLGTAGLVVVFVIFIMLEREPLRDRFIAVISRGNYTVTTRAINDAAERISKYLLAQSIVNGSYGVIIGVGLFCLGLFFGHGVWFPSFVLWGLLCAVLRFIPYVGPAVSSLFPITLALAVYPGFTMAIAVTSMFVVVELISNNIMEPWLYGASTGLSTVAILVAAIFWTWLWGSVGLLVATPLTVCMAVIGKYVKPLRFLHVMLGDEEALPPAVGFYQRLLAGDQVDATTVVRRVGDTHGTSQIADIVYLPAIRLARRDRADDELTAEDENRIFDDTLKIARPAKMSDAQTASTTEQTEIRPLVLAYPAHHRADEVTLELLADSVAEIGLRTTVMSTRSLPTDLEAAIERDKPAVLVIAIMPPGGLPQTRYLCRRLHRRFPELPILIGYWGRTRSFDKLLVRLRAAGASYVMTSFVQICSQLNSLLKKQSATDPAATSTPLVHEQL